LCENNNTSFAYQSADAAQKIGTRQGSFLWEVKDETASVAAQVKEEKEKQQEFEARREYYTSDAYIEQIAREQLGMVKSNEILYINRGE